jgi:hypothetical protein
MGASCSAQPGVVDGALEVVQQADGFLIDERDIEVERARSSCKTSPI